MQCGTVLYSASLGAKPAPTLLHYRFARVHFGEAARRSLPPQSQCKAEMRDCPKRRVDLLYSASLDDLQPLIELLIPDFDAPHSLTSVRSFPEAGAIVMSSSEGEGSAVAVKASKPRQTKGEKEAE